MDNTSKTEEYEFLKEIVKSSDNDLLYKKSAFKYHDGNIRIENTDLHDVLHHLHFLYTWECYVVPKGFEVKTVDSKPKLVISKTNRETLENDYNYIDESVWSIGADNYKPDDFLGRKISEALALFGVKSDEETTGWGWYIESPKVVAERKLKNVKIIYKIRPLVEPNVKSNYFTFTKVAPAYLKANHSEFVVEELNPYLEYKLSEIEVKNIVKAIMSKNEVHESRKLNYKIIGASHILVVDYPVRLRDDIDKFERIVNSDDNIFNVEFILDKDASNRAFINEQKLLTFLTAANSSVSQRIKEDYWAKETGKQTESFKTNLVETVMAGKPQTALESQILIDASEPKTSDVLWDKPLPKEYDVKVFGTAGTMDGHKLRLLEELYKAEEKVEKPYIENILGTDIKSKTTLVMMDMDKLYPEEEPVKRKMSDQYYVEYEIGSSIDKSADVDLLEILSDLQVDTKAELLKVLNGQRFICYDALVALTYMPEKIFDHININCINYKNDIMSMSVARTLLSQAMKALTVSGTVAIYCSNENSSLIWNFANTVKYSCIEQVSYVRRLKIVSPVESEFKDMITVFVFSNQKKQNKILLYSIEDENYFNASDYSQISTKAANLIYANSKVDNDAYVLNIGSSMACLELPLIQRSVKFLSISYNLFINAENKEIADGKFVSDNVNQLNI